LKGIPNLITGLRLVLAIPLGWLILRGDYTWALVLGTVAGLSDALDGFAARTLRVESRLGAMLDPIADKTLILVAFVTLACAGLLPVWLAVLVILRDLVIVGGALTYHALFRDLEVRPTLLSKVNMALQIGYCVLVLLAAAGAWQTPALLEAGAWLVAALACLSGLDYVLRWSRRAMAARRQSGQ
jgi:cardiolipin synthase